MQVVVDIFRSCSEVYTLNKRELLRPFSSVEPTLGAAASLTLCAGVTSAAKLVFMAFLIATSNRPLPEECVRALKRFEKKILTYRRLAIHPRA